PVEWPDGRGISGRMRVEWVAGSAWNRWSDAHGMGGQMTVESAALIVRMAEHGCDHFFTRVVVRGAQRRAERDVTGK
ncbi:hypothetical protein QZM56_36925, partial [Burkholderia contaminans]